MEEASRNEYLLVRTALNVAALVLLGIALSACEQKMPTQSSSSSPTSQTQRNGRYAIVFSPLARADTFLLDTQQGKVWTLTKFTDVTGEPSAWNAMTIIDEGEGKIPGSMTIYDFVQAYPQKTDDKKKH